MNDKDGVYMPLLRCGVESTKGIGIGVKLAQVASEVHFGQCENAVTRHRRITHNEYECVRCGAHRRWGN